MAGRVFRVFIEQDQWVGEDAKFRTRRFFGYRATVRDVIKNRVYGRPQDENSVHLLDVHTHGVSVAEAVDKLKAMLRKINPKLTADDLFEYTATEISTRTVTLYDMRDSSEGEEEETEEYSWLFGDMTAKSDPSGLVRPEEADEIVKFSLNDLKVYLK